MTICASGYPLSRSELEEKMVKFCLLPTLHFIYVLHTTCANRNITQARKVSYIGYLTFSSSHRKKIKFLHVFTKILSYSFITHYTLSYILSLRG